MVNSLYLTADDLERLNVERFARYEDIKRDEQRAETFLTEDADVVVVAFGAAVFLYTQGWGYPTQETVVKELFANPEAASSTVFAKEVDADKAKTMVEPLVADANPAIDGVDKSMSDSTVYVTAKTEQGGDVQYKVSLVRDMIGWKVSSVELYFPSQN